MSNKNYLGFYRCFSRERPNLFYKSPLGRVKALLFPVGFCCRIKEYCPTLNDPAFGILWLTVFAVNSAASSLPHGCAALFFLVSSVCGSKSVFGRNSSLPAFRLYDNSQPQTKYPHLSNHCFLLSD